MNISTFGHANLDRANLKLSKKYYNFNFNTCKFILRGKEMAFYGWINGIEKWR